MGDRGRVVKKERCLLIRIDKLEGFFNHAIGRVDRRLVLIVVLTLGLQWRG